MMLTKKMALILVCVLFIGCANGFSINCLSSGENCEIEQRIRRDTIPDRSSIYLNGTVYTVDAHDQHANWHVNPKQAIVVEDDKIAFVGSNKDAKRYNIDGLSNVYDLNDLVVLPGIHDIHIHPLEAMSLVGGACMLPHSKRPDHRRITNELTECWKYRRGTEWVLGIGYSITPMLEFIREGNSPKDLLDKFVPNRPAAMLEETSHSAWVNSKALELANITKATTERPGGLIMREPNSREPNGILFENEAIEIFNLALDPTGNEEIDLLDYDGSIEALYKLSKYGVTSFCDARVFWKIKHDIVWDKVCNDGNLTARAILGLWAYPTMDDDYQIKELKRIYSDGNAACKLRKSQIKLYMDGVLTSTTAAMHDPYLVNLSLPVISVENVGMNYFDKARLEKYLLELQDFGDGYGFDFHIHAIGDRGISDALDAIESARDSTTSRNPRHRITHLEILDEKDIDRFKKLNVIADFQVAGYYSLPSAHEEFADFVGLEKAKFSIPVKSVVDTGAVAAFSSDWDVNNLNPFVGIQHATQRGDQSVSVKTAIEMYTANPAFAMRQENTVGALKAGMEADFIMIDQDILNIPHDKIGKTKVIETVFMGETIYPEESVLQTIEISSSGRAILLGFRQSAFLIGMYICVFSLV